MFLDLLMCDHFRDTAATYLMLKRPNQKAGYMLALYKMGEIQDSCNMIKDAIHSEMHSTLK